MSRTGLLLLLLIAMVAPRPAAAQPSPATPTEISLTDRVGRWAVEETVWATPGSMPASNLGLTAERHMVGNYLQETLIAGGDAAAKPLRIDYLGFDQVAGRWDYLSLDTRAPVPLMPAWSFDRGDPGHIVLRFEPFALPGSGPTNIGPMLRMQQVITRDGLDHDTKDQFFILADGSGTEWLAHRYDYRRQH